MNGLSHALGLWYGPGKTNPMWLIRIVFVGWIGLERMGDDLSRLAEVARHPMAMLAQPAVLHWLPMPFPPTPDLISLLTTVLMVSGVMGALGILTRLSLAIFGACFLYMGAAAASLGTFNHALSLIVLVLCVLPFTPGVDAWSVDRLILWSFRRQRYDLGGKALGLREALSPPDVPGWGPRLLLAVLCAIYMSAGVSKLRHGEGLDWADGKTLAFYLEGKSDARHQQLTGPRTPHRATAWKDGYGLTAYLYTTASTDIGRKIAQSPRLTSLMSWGTLAFELGFALVFFGTFWRTVMLLAAVSFHAVSDHVMLVHFAPYLWLCLLLVEWPEVLRFAQDDGQASPQY